MKNFVIKYIELSTGKFLYFECRAMSQAEALDTMFETVNDKTHKMYDVYMNTTDVFEYYNIRG